MLYDFWDAFQQGQINSISSTADAAKRDVAHTAGRLQGEVVRLEAKIDKLALVSQALWELIRENTKLSDGDIERKIEEIDIRDGRKDGRMSGKPASCPKCNRPAHTRNRVCPFCGTALNRENVV